MKKLLTIIATLIVVICAGVSAWFIFDKNSTSTNNSNVVPDAVKSDIIYMDSICSDSTKTLKWFETRIELTGEVDTLVTPEIKKGY